VGTHPDVSFSAKHMMITTVRRKFDRFESLASARVMAA
jgi:polyisoprenoid-binding protein YceI